MLLSDISPVPSNDTPAIFLAVAKAVAVAARVAVAALPEVSAALLGILPETISPLMVAEDLFSTLLSDKSDLVSAILLPSIVLASVNLAKSLSAGVPEVSTVPAPLAFI